MRSGEYLGVDLFHSNYHLLSMEKVIFDINIIYLTILHMIFCLM